MRARTIIGLLVALVPIAVGAAQPCLKMVFNQFCLGGSQQTLSSVTMPKASVKSSNPDQIGYDDGGKFVGVVIKKGRVAIVGRTEAPATRLHYLELKAKLTDIYGPPDKDFSYIPASGADDPEYQAVLIHLGKAKLVKAWVEDAWSIRLVWDQRGMVLIYVADNLSSSKEENSGGL